MSGANDDAMPTSPSAASGHFAPYCAPDSPIEFVLLGYVENSQVVLAQASDQTPLALVGYAVSEDKEEPKLLEGRLFHRVVSDPLPVDDSKDNRSKSLVFAWSSRDSLARYDPSPVRQALKRFGLDLSLVLTSESNMNR
jgi:hypothetical protein